MSVLLARDEPTRALVGPDGPLAHGAGAWSARFRARPGVPLFGVATVRAGVLPRWTGWLQIASVPVFILGAFVVSPDAPASLGTMAAALIAWMYYLLFAGYAFGGYALFAQKAREQAPVTEEILGAVAR